MLRKRWLKSLGLASLSLLWLTCSAAAQVSFDDGAHYKAEVDASSTDTIPPGTRITTANWKKY